MTLADNYSIDSYGNDSYTIQAVAAVAVTTLELVSQHTNIHTCQHCCKPHTDNKKEL
jgi:hypothetical protein